MPRLRQIPKGQADHLTETLYKAIFGDRDPTTDPGTETGTPGNWWSIFALVPDAQKHIVDGFQFYRSDERKISPKLRELGQIRAGYAVQSQFVFSQHCKACRQVGFTEDQISAIPHWQVSDLFSELERAVLAYTDALVLEHGRVPEGIFKVLQENLSDEEVLELTYITATYAMHATMSRALRLEFDDVDERMVEVPAPKGSAYDVMGIVDETDD
jgi:alkylhydroperoxidase family enzyme